MKRMSEAIQYPIAALKSCHGSLCYTTQDLVGVLPKPFINQLDMSNCVGFSASLYNLMNFAEHSHYILSARNMDHCSVSSCCLWCIVC